MFGRKPAQERDAYTARKVVIDAYRLFGEAKVEQALRRNIGRSEARLIRDRDRFGGRWTARAPGRAMRLTSKGLEARFTHGAEVLIWKNLQNCLSHSRN